MYLIGYITFEKQTNKILHQNHIEVYYDDMMNRKLYRAIYSKNDAISMEHLHMTDKNDLNFQANCVIITYCFNDQLSDRKCYMITSDVHKALRLGIDSCNIFNSVADLRNHIDDNFGRLAIGRLNNRIARQVNTAVNERFEDVLKKLELLQMKIDELENSKKVEVPCGDLLQLDDDVKTIIKAPIVEY